MSLVLSFICVYPCSLFVAEQCLHLYYGSAFGINELMWFTCLTCMVMVQAVHRFMDKMIIHLFYSTVFCIHCVKFIFDHMIDAIHRQDNHFNAFNVTSHYGK